MGITEESQSPGFAAISQIVPLLMIVVGNPTPTSIPHSLIDFHAFLDKYTGSFKCLEAPHENFALVSCFLHQNRPLTVHQADSITNECIVVLDQNAPTENEIEFLRRYCDDWTRFKPL